METYFYLRFERSQIYGKIGKVASSQMDPNDARKVSEAIGMHSN